MYTWVDTIKYQRYEFLIMLFLPFLLLPWWRAFWAVAIFSVTFVLIRSGRRRWAQCCFHHFRLILTEEGITISISALTEWMVILRQSPSHNIDVIGEELFPVLIEGMDYICQLILLHKLAICKCAHQYRYTCLYDILTSKVINLETLEYGCDQICPNSRSSWSYTHDRNFASLEVLIWKILVSASWPAMYLSNFRCVGALHLFPLTFWNASVICTSICFWIRRRLAFGGKSLMTLGFLLDLSSSESPSPSSDDSSSVPTIFWRLFLGGFLGGLLDGFLGGVSLSYDASSSLSTTSLGVFFLGFTGFSEGVGEANASKLSDGVSFGFIGLLTATMDRCVPIILEKME